MASSRGEGRVERLAVRSGASAPADTSNAEHTQHRAPQRFAVSAPGQEGAVNHRPRMGPGYKRHKRVLYSFVSEQYAGQAHESPSSNRGAQSLYLPACVPPPLSTPFWSFILTTPERWHQATIMNAKQAAVP